MILRFNVRIEEQISGLNSCGLCGTHVFLTKREDQKKVFQSVKTFNLLI